MNLFISSFDIGTKHFAFSVEEADFEKLKKLRLKYKNLPKEYRRKNKGEMNKYIIELQEEMFKSSELIVAKVENIRSENFVSLDIETRKNLFDLLNANKKYFDMCQVFLVEHQFAKLGGRRHSAQINFQAVKIAEDVLAWLIINYPDKIILDFSSCFKTQILGAPIKISKTERKKWAVEKAISIQKLRGVEDENNIFIRKRKGIKVDDISDTLVQCQAYKFKYLIGEF